MTEPDTALAFEPLDERPGFEIVDRIERHRCEIRTDGPVSPTPVDTGEFELPVDRAVQISTESLVISTEGGAVQARNNSGEIVTQVELFEQESLPSGAYSLEILDQFRSFVKVESSIDIAVNGAEIRLDFEAKTDALIAARSTHQRPPATVTTTEDPVDMMAAVSSFGSALKTTKPDRAFGFLRDHPPAIELGDDLEIPGSLETPDTGITIEVPARLEAIYVVAPLAYYLGADVEPGPTPVLRTDDGYEYALTGRGGFETTVERTLKQVFFLDCLTRTEGIYDINLRARNEVEPKVDLDFEELYERSLATQVEAYLSVPYEVLEDHMPEWRLTTHVEPGPETIEQLPFVVNDLAVVKTHTANQVATSPAEPVPEGLTRDEAFTRSAGSQSEQSSRKYVEPDASGSLEQAWIGEEIPIGASKLTRDAFSNRVDREPSEGDISITIVQNDQRMDEEGDLVDEAYGDRDALPLDVTVHRDLSVEELREVLRDETAFLHYIGHTEHDGFECTDGKLDVTTLEETGVEAFLLNSCNSYHQGLGLIETGAVGGIVTLNDVINEGAVRIGETVARLLNTGFPLRAGLDIARNESVLGGQYIVVGDGSMTVSVPASGTALLSEITKTEQGWEVELETYVSDINGLGTVFWPHFEDNDEFFLSSGTIGSFTLSEEELRTFLKMEDAPVRIDNELHWTGSLDLERVLK